MILVYSNTISPRLEYTLKVIFNTILNVDFKVVDLETFKKNTNTPRINYSIENVEDCLQIIPEGLLSQENIVPKNISVSRIQSVPCFFKTSEKNIFNYDIFAATFYMVTRYEEYLPSILDIHKRFKAENSLAYKNNFLKKPVVNIWANKLRQALKNKYPELLFSQQKFSSINSLDIDIAYAYKGKSIFRIISSTLKSILSFDKEELKSRYQYFIKKQQDPLDSYSSIITLNKKYKTDALFFFHLGSFGKYDKSLHWKSKTYRKLITHLSNKYQIGMHPSYKSNNNFEVLSSEKKRLEIISTQVITKSRQHFLKLTFPSTYENLIKIGIKEDYSMGFASQIGLRAGICTPYPFFNLVTNQERTLVIYPFQIMDGTLKDYLKLNPNEAIKEIKEVIFEVKKVDGLFISVWHNSSLSETNGWGPWIKVYEKLLELSK